MEEIQEKEGSEISEENYDIDAGFDNMQFNNEQDESPLLARKLGHKNRIHVKGTSQETRLGYINHILRKAKKTNKLNDKGDIFNVDSILVEKAVVEQTKMAEKMVFTFVVTEHKARWRYIFSVKIGSGRP